MFMWTLLSPVPTRRTKLASPASLFNFFSCIKQIRFRSAHCVYVSDLGSNRVNLVWPPLLRSVDHSEVSSGELGRQRQRLQQEGVPH